MPLIAFEGGDGVGKATQSKLLVNEINKSTYRQAVLYSFPRYDTDVGKIIEGMLKGTVAVSRVVDGVLSQPAFDPLIFQCLMIGDKNDAASVIVSLLEREVYVVCDRWKASAKSYGASDGLSRVWLDRSHEVLPNADLTFFLKVPEAVAFERRPVLRDRYEKDRSKQVAVSANYEELARTEPGWKVVDGSGTVEQVSASVLRLFEAKFGRLV